MYSSALFYERLSALCRAHSTCITMFAKNVLRTSTSAPTNWKNGAVPSAEIVFRAAQALNVSADYLLGLSDSPERIPGAYLTHEEAALIRELRESKPQARCMAIASMRAVLGISRDAREDGTV